MAWSKESRHKRGYGTAWDKLRKQILERDNYLCQECKRNGRITSANIVDHIINKATGGKDTESNLEAICKEHHDIKTLKESGRNPKRKVSIGLDGWII